MFCNLYGTNLFFNAVQSSTPKNAGCLNAMGSHTGLLTESVLGRELLERNPDLYCTVQNK